MNADTRTDDPRERETRVFRAMRALRLERRTALRAKFLAVGVILLAGAPTPAQAASSQHEGIRETARAFLASQFAAGDPATVEIGAIDPRLRLAPCNRLNAFLAPGAGLSGATTVGVRCADAGGWTLYLSATVRRPAMVVVLRRPVARGAAISAADIGLESRDLSSVGGSPITEPAEAVGMVARQALAAGAVLRAPLLVQAQLVRRGDNVSIMTETGGITVRAAGEALEDGAAGESIRVRNVQSRRLLQATVIGPGVVQTGQPGVKVLTPAAANVIR